MDLAPIKRRVLAAAAAAALLSGCVALLLPLELLFTADDGVLLLLLVVCCCGGGEGDRDLDTFRSVGGTAAALRPPNEVVVVGVILAAVETESAIKIVPSVVSFEAVVPRLSTNKADSPPLLLVASALFVLLSMGASFRSCRL